MKFQDFENILMKDEEFRKEYLRTEVEQEISLEILMARAKLGLTQKQLALMVGTKQPSIARLENGEKTPSIGFLKKIAAAFKTKLIIGFEINKTEVSHTVTFEFPKVTQKIGFVGYSYNGLSTYNQRLSC